MELTAIETASAAATLGALATGATLFHLWWLSRQETGLAYIGAAFTLVGVRQLVVIGGWAGLPAVFLLTDVLLVAATVLLVAGGCRLTGRRVPLKLLTLVGAALAANATALYALGVARGPSRVAGFLPIAVFASVSAIAVGVTLLRYQRKHPGFGYGLAAGQFWMLAAIAAPAPFIQRLTWLMPAYLLLGMVLYLGIALCLIVATQRRQQVEVLASQRRFQDLVMTASDWIWETDAENRFTYVSPRIEDITGLPAEQHIGKRPGESIHRTLIDPTASPFAEIARQRAPFRDRQVSMTRLDGQVRILSISGNPILAPDGTLLGYRGTGTDVTEPTRLRATLAAVHAAVAASVGADFFRILMRHMSRDLGVEYAFAGRLIPGRRVDTLSFCRKGQTCGNLAYDLDGTPCDQTLAGDDVCIYETGVRARFPHDFGLADMGIDGYAGTAIRGSDGKVIGLIALMHTGPLPDPEIIKTVLSVISARAGAELERQIAETALRESEARFRLLVDNLPSAFHICDADGRVVLMNKEALRRLEHRETVVGRMLVDVVTHMDGVSADAVTAELQDVIATRRTTVRERVVRSPDGRERTVLTCRFPILGEADAVYIGTLLTDLTNVKAMERQVALNEARLQRVVTALDLSHRGIVVEDKAGHAIYVNATASRLLGPGASATSILEQLGQLAELHDKGAWSGDVLYPRRDASDVLLSISGARLPDGGTVLLVEDATERLNQERERKALERQLQESQKLEAVGQLAGGIAHDFNNLVGAIQGFASFIAEDTAADSPQHAYAERILAATRRGKRLIKQILAFSRREEAPRQPLPLRELVMESADLLKATLPATSNLVLNNRLPDAVVNANATQIIQILINLSLNASDALAENPGTITMAVEPLAADDARLRRLTTAPAGALALDNQPDGTSVCHAGHLTPGRDYLVVSVSDMGSGIDPGILPKIFDPFFTTKARGRGTGLGLSVVHGLVLAHEGALVVTTKPGSGTRFEVVLPLVRESAPERRRETTASTPERTRARRGRILVVDDDEAFADMLITTLDRAGYEAAVSTSPADALEAFQGAPELWDVLVTDYTMPEITGLNLIAQMKSLNPNLACILCTGYAGDGFGRMHAMEGGADAFFSKPVESAELLKMISLLVDAAHGRRLAMTQPKVR